VFNSGILEETLENRQLRLKKRFDPIVLKNGIFVVGHPRSGTSLACQLLKSAGSTFPPDFGGRRVQQVGLPSSWRPAKS